MERECDREGIEDPLANARARGWGGREGETVCERRIHGFSSRRKKQRSKMEMEKKRSKGKGAHNGLMHDEILPSHEREEGESRNLLLLMSAHT